MYRVFLERAAEKALRRLTAEVHDRVLAAIQGLATNPRPPGCRKLACHECETDYGYRFRRNRLNHRRV